MRLLIALPVLDEEKVLEDSVGKIVAVCRSDFPDDETVIVISDNGSADRTGEIGKELAARYESVRYLHTGEKGKGIAIRRAWQSEEADIYAFMDIDLSTDLESLPNLVDAARKSGGVAIGSRFHRDSKVSRSLMRKFVSSGYRLVLRTLLGTHIDDAPCGFKAASAEVVDNILPFVRDDRWFFDTELVIRAERGGYDVVQVPVIWSEKTVPGRASKVNVPKLAIDYFRKVIELKKRLK